MSLARAFALAGALLASSLAPTSVHAQEEAAEDDDEARMHFRLGRAYYDSGRFAEAAGEFEQAYQLSGRSALLYNLYVSYRDAGQPREAADRLRRYLAEEQNVENRSQLEARLVSLDRMLAQQGAQPADTGGGGDAPGDGGGDVPPDDGGGGSTDGAASGGAVSGGATTAPSDGGGGGTWVPGWIIAAGGAALVIGGVITGVLALDAQSRLADEHGCTDAGACNPGFEATRDEGALLAGLTDGFLIGGGVIAVAGVVLALVLADSGDSDTAVSAACGPDGCMASLAGRFE